MQHINLITRRGFLDRSCKIGLATALSTLADIPFVMKRALADGSIGRNNKKLLFVFLRGANDALNSVIPVLDPSYVTARPQLKIPFDDLTDYSTIGPCDFAVSGPDKPTFDYGNAIRLGNGFAGLHPSLKFLAPLYNAGDLALIHRVGYPKQSRSHFDSQNYWETGTPNSNAVKDGIFYRAMVESGLANTSPLTGVSVQSSLPLSLRGSKAAMTNLNDPTRYDLLGLPPKLGDKKADAALRVANGYPFSEKKNRDLLDLQYGNLMDTLSIFASLDFSDAGNTFVDDENTDGDTAPYYLFPDANAKNGGYAVHGNNAQKYAVDTGSYDFFRRLKAAALILNKTDAIVAGTEMGGFDTHSNQGILTGAHPNLQKRIAWAMYALRKYFTKYSDKATWNNLVVVTLSEFGRTTKENSDVGTDHAEAGVMFVAGGAVKGYKKGNNTGVFACSPNDAANGQTIPWKTGNSGSMFGASGRYLLRAVDYRSVLGELIRDHLGGTQEQLNRIIPGYAVTGEALQKGGISTKDGVRILGELGLV
jgi:uncharacterized protein (DUF1501 family)